MRKASFAAAAMFASLLLLAPLAAQAATSVFEDFNTGWTPGHMTEANAQANGWRYVEDQGFRDVAIDGNALRMSNAVEDGNFGNWLFSERLTPAVSEDPDGNEFVAEYDISSTSPDFQPNLQISISPQSLDGARMSFLKFVDSPADADGPGGIDVYFADFRNGGTPTPAIKIANDKPRSGFHVKIVLDLYTGPSNDVAQVFINNNVPLVPASGGIEGFYAPVDNPETVNKAKAGQTIPVKFTLNAEPATTWEDYYRFNPESNDDPDSDVPGQTTPPATWTTRSVDSLIFQARGSGTYPALNGNGFRIDNVSLTNSATATLPTGATGDPSLLGPNPFTAMTKACDSDDALDPIETYTPGASGLTFNATTGIWHYNWQTKNQYAGNCVELTLNLTDDFALFKFTK